MSQYQVKLRLELPRRVRKISYPRKLRAPRRVRKEVLIGSRKKGFDVLIKIALAAFARDKLIIVFLAFLLHFWCRNKENLNLGFMLMHNFKYLLQLKYQNGYMCINVCRLRSRERPEQSFHFFPRKSFRLFEAEKKYLSIFFVIFRVNIKGS